MDLFFNGNDISISDALKDIFSKCELKDVELLIKNRVYAKVRVDSRGAALIRCRTLTGMNVVAEVFYAEVRRGLVNSGCTFQGPDLTPDSIVGFSAKSDKIRVRFCPVLEEKKSALESKFENFEFI